MKVGKYDIHTLETGRFGLDGGAMFGIVPRALWQKTNPPDGQNRIDMAMRALLLKSNDRTIIVDTGVGSKFASKQVGIYKIDFSEFSLDDSLKALDVSREQITDVVLTHLHFDHAGGATIHDDKGSPIPAFPNATYHVQKSHWEHALKPTMKDAGSFIKDDFLPLEEHGVLNFLDGEGTLFDQLTVHLVNGHTIDQQIVKISGSSDSETVLFCADLVPTSSHIPLPYIMSYDLHPLTTLAEKRHYLNEACDAGYTLVFEHDPAFSAGRLTRTDKGIVLGEHREF